MANVREIQGSVSGVETWPDEYMMLEADTLAELNREIERRGADGWTTAATWIASRSEEQGGRASRVQMTRARR